jgi:hypothetical protein
LCFHFHTHYAMKTAPWEGESHLFQMTHVLTNAVVMSV